MELAIRGQHARALNRQRGKQAQHEFVGVRRENDACRIGKMEMPRNVRLRLRQDLPHDRGPFIVPARGGDLPRRQMRVMRHIRPKVMAVRGEMQFPRIGR
jgi:hypothetical protein